MDLFQFDVVGDNELLNKKSEAVESTALGLNEPELKDISKQTDNQESIQGDNEDDEEYDFGGLPPPSKDISHIINRTLLSTSSLLDGDQMKKSKKQKSFDEFSESMGWSNEKKSKHKNNHSSSNLTFDVNVSEEILQKELKKVDTLKLEKEYALENPSSRRAKLLRKIERSKTKGKEWFNMPATEKTEEIENDLKVLQMRSALDPKRFYKKNDLKVLPKYFQIGTVQHSPLDYYNEKDTRRNKKHSIVDELLADTDFQKYNKRKYKEIMEKNQRKGYNKALKKMKKLKKKK